MRCLSLGRVCTRGGGAREEEVTKTTVPTVSHGVSRSPHFAAGGRPCRARSKGRTPDGAMPQLSNPAPGPPPRGSGGPTARDRPQRRPEASPGPDLEEYKGGGRSTPVQCADWTPRSVGRARPAILGCAADSSAGLGPPQPASAPPAPAPDEDPFESPLRDRHRLGWGHLVNCGARLSSRTAGQGGAGRGRVEAHEAHEAPAAPVRARPSPRQCC